MNPTLFLLAQTPHGARITGVIESCPHESLFYSHIKHLQNHLLAFKDRRDALTSAEQARDFHLLLLASCLQYVVNKKHFFYTGVPSLELKPFC